MKILASILTFFILLMPLPAQADTCVDDLINLNTGICIKGGPELGNPLGLGQTQPAPTSAPQAPAPQPAPQKPAPQPQKKPVAQKPSVKKTPSASRSATGGSSVTPDSKDKKSKSKSDKEKPCVVLTQEEPPATIEVGYTTATVAGIALGVLFAAFLVFYRRK